MFGPGFLFFVVPPYFPALCACVGLARRPAALQNSSPSNSHYPSASHREFANIRASAQEAAHAPELTNFLGMLCCAKGLQVEVRAHSASKFSIAFCGDCFGTASLFSPPFAIVLLTYLFSYFYEDSMLGTVGLENSLLEKCSRRPC